MPINWKVSIPPGILSGRRTRQCIPIFPRGTNVFRVKASNNDGVWNEEGASVRVIHYPHPLADGMVYLFAGGNWGWQGCMYSNKFRTRLKMRELEEKKREEMPAGAITIL